MAELSAPGAASGLPRPRWHPIKATAKWAEWVKEMEIHAHETASERERRHRENIHDALYNRRAGEIPERKTEG